MSHDQNTPNRMASSTPSAPSRSDGLPPQPGIWLDPLVGGDEAPESPVGDLGDEDPVVIADDGGEAEGGLPHRRQLLPYGRGYVKRTDGTRRALPRRCVGRARR